MLLASVCYEAPPSRTPTQRKLDAIVANHSTGLRPRFTNTLLSIVANCHYATGALCITSVSVSGPHRLSVAFVRNGEPLDAELRAVDLRRVSATVYDARGNVLHAKDNLFNMRDFYVFLKQE